MDDQTNRWSVLETSHKPQMYETGAMVYWQGSRADAFYYLKSGGVRVFLVSENGAEKTLNMLKPGQIFGEAAFFDGLPRVSSAKTTRRSAIIPVTHRSLLECIRREPQLAMHLLTYLSQTIRLLSAQVDTVTFQQADERLARLLLNLSADGANVRITHEDLAARVGVSRVTVSRILAEFARRGWVETSYREILVTNGNAIRTFLRKKYQA
jgi:CRP-like cAMP-binding protein